MALKLAASLCFVGLAFPIPAAACEPPREDVTHTSGDVGVRIVAFVQELEANGFSGAVLAAKGGEVIAAVAAGYADDQNEMPNTPTTLFEIASVTKPFTSAAVLRLVQDGKLNLNDSIAGHLPGVPEDCHGITIEHLLRHTSGIPGTNTQGRGDDIERVLPSFLRGGPVHEPGTHWGYWNQGYALLSEIISRASGMTYIDYCREALFDAAGMSATMFTGDDPPDDVTVAVGESQFGPSRSALEHPYGSYGFQYRGMGGIVTNVLDLWRWDRALHTDDILNTEMRDAMFEPGLNNYALGWFVRENERGRLVQTHTGGVRGFIAAMHRYPDDDALLVVLANRDDVRVNQITNDLERILFEDTDEGMHITFATAPYLDRMNEHGFVQLPGTLRWRVLPRYTGVQEDGTRIVDDRITLILSDDERRFWPLIVRMDTRDAEQLIEQLEAMIEQRRAAGAE